MTCRYCNSANQADDHRCQRCGRRLHVASARPAPDTYPGIRRSYPVQGARALAAQPVAVGAALMEPARVTEPGRLMEDVAPVPESVKATAPRAPFQPALFTTRELGRIVPIETYHAPKVAERSVKPAVRPSAPRSQRTKAESAMDVATTHQQAFQFATATVAIATPRSRTVPQETVRYANAPVAIPLHRALATIIDSSIVLTAVTMAALVIHFLVGLDAFGGYILPAMIALTALTGIGYKLLWIWADTDSPGLAWTQLRLLDFDGRKPTQRQRLQRLGWACISLLPAGVGLLWSMVDEETLSWHDHSSETFLTSFCAGSQ